MGAEIALIVRSYFLSVTQKPWVGFDRCRVTMFTWFSGCTQNAKGGLSSAPELVGSPS